MSRIPESERRILEIEKLKRQKYYNEHKNYGVISFFGLVLSIFLFGGVLKYSAEAISCILESEKALQYAQYAGLLFCGAIIVLILSLCFAGASIAVNRGGIFGGLVIALFLTPLIYAMTCILLGLEMDAFSLLDFGSSSTASDPVPSIGESPIGVPSIGGAAESTNVNVCK